MQLKLGEMLKILRMGSRRYLMQEGETLWGNMWERYHDRMIELYGDCKEVRRVYGKTKSGGKQNDR